MGTINAAMFAVAHLRTDAIYQKQYKNLIELKGILNDIFELLGYELSTPEYSSDYCLKSILNSECKMELSSNNGNGILVIEIHDLRYPLNQGSMKGGYTVMPWVWGRKIDLKDPSSLNELEKFISNPFEYLSIDRDCSFGDRTSKCHGLPEFVEFGDACYHD